jgi:electron transfer flavoprotein alpha subunit
MSSICALIVVRDGALPAGAAEVFDVARRHNSSRPSPDSSASSGVCGLIVGVGAAQAASQLEGNGSVEVIEIDPLHFSLRNCAELARQTAMIQHASVVLIPSSPDGRDIAPRMSVLLDAPLLSGAVRVISNANRFAVEVSRSGGFVIEQHRAETQVVVTLIPGLSGVEPSDEGPSVTGSFACVPGPGASSIAEPIDRRSVVSLVVLPPDPATMDLTEASHIVAGGQGLKTAEAFEELGRIGTALGASLGGTRVASDAGWISFERQIGTTGVIVSPKVYIAFGISGATQHTSGLGSPELIISVNTDPSCPMMKMSDVAIVSDACAVLEAIARRLTRVNA